MTSVGPLRETPLSLSKLIEDAQAAVPGFVATFKEWRTRTDSLAEKKTPRIGMIRGVTVHFSCSPSLD